MHGILQWLYLFCLLFVSVARCFGFSCCRRVVANCVFVVFVCIFVCGFCGMGGGGGEYLVFIYLFIGIIRFI